MPKYNVRVEVVFDYEVEVDNEKEAEEQGWAWEDYRPLSEVNSIDVELIQDEDDDEEE